MINKSYWYLLLNGTDGIINQVHKSGIIKHWSFKRHYWAWGNRWDYSNNTIKKVGE